MKKSPVLPRGRAVVGIDIGKGKHAATALSPQGEVIAQLASFPNTRQGVDRLEQEILRKAGGPGKVLVGMEATGHYWMCQCHELTRRGYACVVFNPLQTNARSRACVRKTRNDKIDSKTIARLVLAGEAKPTRVPDRKITELRLLVRHRHRLLQAAGDMERYAHTLVDRIFPEYAGVFCRPFLPSAQKLIRQIGIAPEKLVKNAEQVRELLRVAGRKMITDEKIERLLQAAQESIGIREAEDVIEAQLRSIFDYLDTVRRQIAEIDKQLDERAGSLIRPCIRWASPARWWPRSTPNRTPSATSPRPTSTWPTRASTRAGTIRATRSSGEAKSANAVPRCCVVPCILPRSLSAAAMTTSLAFTASTAPRARSTRTPW